MSIWLPSSLRVLRKRRRKTQTNEREGLRQKMVERTSKNNVKASDTIALAPVWLCF